jgi:cobalt-zinc-cadmium efflux system protein
VAEIVGQRQVSGGSRHRHGAVTIDTSARRLAVVLGLIVTFMVGEVLAGILAHSLALLSDAAHMLTDAGAIALSLVALRLAARPARGNLTFGLRRAEILSAQVNGGTLLVLAALILYEAVHRLLSPPAVAGWTVLAVALVGVAVNLIATWQLAKANRQNMAVEGSYQHIITDLYAFFGTLVAASIIVTTGFMRADAIASLLVVGLMLRSAYGLLRDSGRVLLEAAPAGLDPHEIGHALALDGRVVEVHDLHVWEIGSGFPSLSAHVLVEPLDDCHGVRRDLERMLHDRFGIDHTTLQVDHKRATTHLIAASELKREPEPR